jgi:hypothetical protein
MLNKQTGTHSNTIEKEKYIAHTKDLLLDTRIVV